MNLKLKITDKKERPIYSGVRIGLRFEVRYNKTYTIISGSGSVTDPYETDISDYQWTKGHLEEQISLGNYNFIEYVTD